MNIPALIKVALTPLGLPIAASVYKGSATEYLTYNYSDERPVIRADDEDIIEETSLQVHYFTKANPLSMKRRLRNALRAVGFVIESTQELYENDTKFYHIIVEVWIQSEVDDITDDEVFFTGDDDLFYVQEEE